MSIAIKVENLSKQYRLGQIGSGTISKDLNRWYARVRGKEDPYATIGEVNDRTQKGTSDFAWALKDINFEVQQGEVLGIIGRNGAGKSTLLKVLSKVTAPSTGSIKAKGRIASLLEVGTGFHPEMTGRENIYMNGTIMGMTKHEINRKLDEIVDFAGVAKYLDTPTKRYSSGMSVRLGFAIAAHLEPEILIVDEVLAVGDAEFQKKAIGKMQDVANGEGRTVLFVSHNMGSIQKLCTKGLLLNQGFISFMGDTTETIKKYNSIFKEKPTYQIDESNKEVYFKSIAVEQANNDNNSFLTDASINIKLLIDSNINITPGTKILVRILSVNGMVLFCDETNIISNKKEYVLKVAPLTFMKGVYSLNCIIYEPAIAQYDNINGCDFSIINNTPEFVHLEGFDIGNISIKNKWD